MELNVDIRRHAYDQLTVLEDIKLTVQAGEIVAVVGPSGCGKSTLLGIIGGILKPTDGVVMMNGPVPANCLNPLTYVFQDFALLPWLNVADNVGFPLEHHPLDEAERKRRIADALVRTNLADFAHALPKQLSGGMRQRVGIARALVVKPAVLLMDEPMSALDAQTRDLLMDDFLNLWMRERITAVYVTHNLAEALQLANRIVILSRRPGKIRSILEIPIPQGERKATAAQMELTALGEQLWSLIRQEAASADQEILDV